MSFEDESAEKEAKERSVNRRFYLPRLKPEEYRGYAVVHWSLPMEERAKGWLNDKFHSSFRELMLHAGARESLLCPVYCLMPDHLHLIWMGASEQSDQRRGMAFQRTHLKRALAPARFQHQAHDHVLREDERKQDAFANACSYVLSNPVRAELVISPDEWKYSGAVVPGYPTLHPLHQENYWELVWKIYRAKREAK